MSMASGSVRPKGKKAKKDGRTHREATERRSSAAAPAIVSRTFGANKFVGAIKEGNYGCQYLEGNAKYTWGTGVSYEGTMSGSAIQGKGKFSWPDGSSYQGELQAGKRHGQGVYVAADGVTTYEGQWKMGKRHGAGKLVYTADATSFYEGEWDEGLKHGKGKQVWPSGNCYDGDWVAGKMRGKGTMTWTSKAGEETYTGLWEDNNPHGDGTHTWRSANEPGAPTSPTADAVLSATAGSFGSARLPQPPPLHTQQQQQVNRYSGQWHGGKRSGFGTFYYANGASYAGEWQDHLKQGRGRHTLEDGRVYECEFAGDRPVDGPRELVEGVSPSTGKGPAENPVSKLIEVTDMVHLALPKDLSGLAAAAGTGYQETSKIFREVYNAALRHLSMLRDLYKQYRLLIPSAGEDPFVMRTFQLWAFARDAGLITPGLPLAQLDRAVFNGPRLRREVAPADDSEVRPLTPELSEAPRATTAEGVATEAPSSVARGSLASRGQRRGSQGSQATEEDEEGDQATESGTDWGSRPASSALVGQSARESRYGESEYDEEDEEAAAAAREAAAAAAEAAAIAAAAEEAQRKFTPLDGDFRREEGCGAADIHHHLRPLLFRHFMEGVVRLSPAAYPRERGLESQVLRLLAENASPVFGRSETPDSPFAFLTEQEFQAVLGEYQPRLWELFQSCAGVEPDDGSVAAERPGGYGAARRRLPVGARLDRTVRLKDVLRMLSNVGILKPMLQSSVPEGEEPTRLLPELEEAAKLAAEAAALAAADEGEPTEDASPGKQGSTAASDMAPNQEPSPDRAEDAASPAGAPDAPGGEAHLPPVLEPLDDPTMASCDFCVTVVEAVRIVTQAMSPGSADVLRWRLPPTSKAPEDDSWQSMIPMLEFLETELVYPEFTRLLLQVAEHGADTNPALKESVPASSRFHTFLQHVLVPALETPYVPPSERKPEVEEEPAEELEEEPPQEEPKEEKGDKKRAGSKPGGKDKLAPDDRQPSKGNKPGSRKPSKAPPAEEQEVVEQVEIVPVVPEGPSRIIHWLGFDATPPGALPEGVRAAPAPRWWPQDYADDVLAW